jgi:tetratricopeptide (TPR) repeat protein
MRVLGGERGAYALAQALPSIQVPATVQSVLAARIDRLSLDEKHLLQSASVIGKDVPLALLEAVAGLPEDVLLAHLARLQATEFLYEASLFPEAEYTFKHALTHEVAYQSLLGERRRELHARIAEAMESLYADRLAEQVERLAYHALHGAMPTKAIKYLHQAGDKAVARSANREAVAFLEQALQVLAELPEDRETVTEALEIRLTLGPSLIAVAGPSAATTYEVYRRARELCDQVGHASRLFAVLWGQWFTTIGRGDYHTGRELAEQLLAAAQERGQSALLLEAHHSLWATLFILGEFGDAKAHFEEGLRLYDPRQHRAHAFVYGGHDPGVCCRNFLGLVTWELGYPDQAVRRNEEALGLATELNHPVSLIWANYYAAWIRYRRREFSAATERAESVLALSTPLGLTAWSEYVLLFLAVLRAEQGDDAGILRDVERGFAAARAASWGFRETWLMSRLLEVCGKAGHASRALEILSEMLAQPNIASLDDPELHRLKGELLLRVGADVGDAEISFRRALGAARRRQARSRELGVATSLCRLLDRRGRREEGRRMLAEIYGWFTEGLDTADLRDAKALLEELSPR